MTSTRRQRSVPAPRASAGREGTDELRQMVLLLETAEVLELRARRAKDVAKVTVLLRRAESRRTEAARIREILAAKAPPGRARSGDSQPTFSPPSPPGQDRRR